MIVHAAVLRYSADKPTHLIIRLSRNEMLAEVMATIKGALFAADLDLYHRIDWKASPDTMYEQYMTYTVEGNRPIEFDYLGNYDTYVAH